VRKVVIRGERRAELVEVPDPKPKEDWVVVEVHSIPMCTEYKAWVTGTPTDYLGHEAVGKVVAVDQPTQVAVGDRVVVQPRYACGKCEFCLAGEHIHCQNNIDFQAFMGTCEGSATYAQHVVKPSWLLSKIPDDVSYAKAGLALCGLGPTFGALQTLGVTAYDTVLITGLGPVGLGGVVNTLFRNARVIAVESSPWRVKLAMEMGATAVLHPKDPEILRKIQAMTEGKGVDCAIECAGNVEAERLCIDAVRRKGKVAFVGLCEEKLQIEINSDMLWNGLTLTGSWHYNLAHFPQVVKVIQQSPLIDLLISHVLPMSEVEQAFGLQVTGNCAKIILDPSA
jgi:L-iditol 2-dehydrogenase